MSLGIVFSSARLSLLARALPLGAYFGWHLATLGTPVDISKLPPPAQGTVDFVKDIKPLLEHSCLKCHEPEKSKGKLRLDTRELALKGGENGPDILPGQSSKSPLIHFTAGLVEDSE